MDTNKIELVVFDMAGTTVNDAGSVHQAFQEAMGEYKLEVSYQEVNEVMGFPKPTAIEVLLKKHAPELCSAEVIDKIHKRFVDLMVSHYKNDEGVTEKPHTSETFKTLKQAGIKVAVDTGFSLPIAGVIVDRLGWQKNGLIDVLVTSDQVPRGRPYPDMIYRAMELTGVKDAKKVAKVGDTASDLQQGNAAGVQYVIGVTTGAYTREELTKEKHTHLIEQLDALPDIVLQ
ncbi:MAG: HAD hydrolase-like protein [Cyclobacteriaceae bacterium]|nr:HAD hydrolase-like protein [Cyclobacteriaceae bacterium]